MNACDRIEKLVACKQRPSQQALGLLLVGSDHGGLGFKSVLESFAIGVEQSLDAAGSREFDQLAIKMRRNSGLDAPANQQPARFLQQGLG